MRPHGQKHEHKQRQIGHIDELQRGPVHVTATPLYSTTKKVRSIPDFPPPEHVTSMGHLPEVVLVPTSQLYVTISLGVRRFRRQSLGPVGPDL